MSLLPASDIRLRTSHSHWDRGQYQNMTVCQTFLNASCNLIVKGMSGSAVIFLGTVSALFQHLGINSEIFRFPEAGCRDTFVLFVGK